MAQINSRMDACMVLGVKPDATEGEIKSAYKNLVKQYHPDSQKDQRLHWQYYDAVEAYEYLLDHPIIIDKQNDVYRKEKLYDYSNVEETKNYGGGTRPNRIIGNASGTTIRYGSSRYEQEREVANWEQRRKKEKKEELKRRQDEMKQKDEAEKRRAQESEQEYRNAMRMINIIRAMIKR